MSSHSSDPQFYRRSVSGFVAVLFTTGVRCTAGAILHLFMVRLLLPEAFGVYVFALLCVQGFHALTNLGVQKYIIQSKSPGAIHSAFWVKLVWSSLMWLLAMAITPQIATFIGSAEGGLLFRILALQLLITPITETYMGIAERNAHHGIAQKANRLGIYAELVVGVLALAMGYGAAGVACAIVFRGVIEAACLVSTLGLSPLKAPDGHTAAPELRALLSFGLPLLASGLLVFGYWNVDDIFVGKMLGDVELGYYGFAFRFPHYLTLLGTAIITVALPVLSRLQDDNVRAGRFFSGLTRATAYAMTLCVVLCLLFGADIIVLAFGTKWLPALVPFQIFTAVVAFRNIAIYWTALHQSRGITKYMMVSTPVNLCGIVVLSLLFISRWGITGVAAAVAITMAVSLVAFVPWFVRKILPDFSYLVTLARPLVYGIAAWGAGWLLMTLLPASLWAVGALIVTGVFAALVGVTDRRLIEDLKEVWRLKNAH